MEPLVVYNSENAVAGDKLKGRDGGVGTAIGVAGRKKLAEITNLPCASRVSSQFERSQTVSVSAKEFIHQLQNENMALKKVLVDRNKLIESSRVELHKLRVNLEKVQLQNVQLAQANSQMLQELNSGKDRLKALQHELGCRNSLLKALQPKVDTINSTKDVVPAQPDNENKDKTCDKLGGSSRRRSSISNSAKVADTVKIKAESQDVKKRRQSTRFNCNDSKTGEDVFVTDEVEVPLCSVTADPAGESSVTFDHSVRKVGAKKKADNQDSSSRKRSMRLRLDITQTSATEEVQTMGTTETETPRAPGLDIYKKVKDEDIEDTSLTIGSQVSHRHSTARPQRHAAVKIQSYKEVPVNVKLRRPE